MQNSRTDNSLIYDNVVYHFPESWRSESFEAVLVSNLPSYRKYKRKEIASIGKIPVIDQGQEEVAGYIDDEKGKYSGELPLIIFGDHTRNVKYVDFDFAVGADGTKLLKPKEELIEKFFYYYLRSIFIPPSGYSRHYKYLKEIQVPIPDRKVQLDIIKQLDATLPKVQLQVQRLAKAKKMIAKFRQTILLAAVTGKLTEDWRKKNPKISSAETLVKEISNKQMKNGVNNLAYFSTESEALPENWCISKISSVTECVDKYRKPINADERKNRLGKIPYYGANGQVGWIDDYLFNEDLVVIVEDETFTGRKIPFSYIIRGKTWVNNHAHVLRPLGEITVDYLNICFSYYDFTALTSGTTGRRKLTQGALMNAEFMLAPLKEQEEIVKSVNYYLDIANQVEKQIEKAEKGVGKLTQAILAKTFKAE